MDLKFRSEDERNNFSEGAINQRVFNDVNENEEKDQEQEQEQEHNNNNQVNPNDPYKDNLIYTWGFAKYGQIGLENTNYVLTPTMIDFSQIINSDDYTNTLEIEPVAGESHSAILIKDTEESLLYTFGKNAFGQLGLGNNAYVFEPLLVSSLNPKEKIMTASLGGEHTMLLTNSNNIYTCGLNIFGQLGTGDFENRQLFTNINISNILKDKEKITNIAAGAQHNIISTNKNNIFYCGFNRNNFLGITEDINTFTLINNNNNNCNILSNKKINLIRAGLNINGALLEDKKSIALWGQSCQLINQSSDIVLLSINDINRNISSDEEIKDFKFGNEFMVVLLSKGAVYTCGVNTKNQLGIENANIPPSSSGMTFYKVEFPENVNEIEVGYDYSIGISVSGKLYGWGGNLYGQICQTDKSSFASPKLINNSQIKNLKLKKLSCGGYHSIALYKGNLNNIEQEGKIFDVSQTKLSTLLENDYQDIEKIVDILVNAVQFSKELKQKEENINQKLKEIKKKEKELGSVSTNNLHNLCRGFENTFEIALDELEFDEENSEIGKGTFGDVLRGMWRGEDVAVKFLKGSMTDSPESVKQFVDECNILKNLHHPNILLYMGACTTGPQYFVVTEYCDNGNLFEFLHIQKGNKLTYGEARKIALEIAYGMNYLHGFRPPILHRDLKSMNVLLDRNNTVKLADFGNTRSLQVQMTKQKGTFQWMAPEVIRGNTYTEKSDVFSFGIILNELVTRAPPYQGTDKKDVAKKVVNNPNYRPPYNPKKVQKDWIDIMVKCWQHDEKLRPTFNEVIDMLNKAKLSENVLIRQPQ